MAANFPNSTKTWTPLTNGTTTDVSHVNTLYDEVTAVENTLLSGTDKQILSNVNGVPTWTNASAAGESVNVEDIGTNNKTLTSSDAMYQFIDWNSYPSGRNLYLPTTNLYNGMKFFIYNMSGSGNWDNYGVLTVYYDTTIIATIGQLSRCEFIYNGTTWVPLDTGYMKDNYTINIGNNTKATGNGISIGYNANGQLAIGANATGYFAIGKNSFNGLDYTLAIGPGSSTPYANYGAIALGSNAIAKGGFAFGRSANTNGMNMAAAFGYHAKCERWDEYHFDFDYTDTNKNGYSFLPWYGTTTDATETEIFLGGTSNKRCTVLASSAFMYSINVVAYDSINNVGMTFEIKGGIKRDTTNNTSLIGTSTTTIISQDGTPGWTISASADDTNEALVLKVTGAAGTTIKWNAIAHISELRI